MSKSYEEKVSEEKSKSYKRSGTGHLDVQFDDDEDTNRFDVRLAVDQSDLFILQFALFEGGEGGENRFIEVDVYKSALSEKIEFPDASRATFLFQSGTQEWRPAKGWVRAEWDPVKRTLKGLLGNVESGRPEHTKVTWGKFEVTID